MTRRFDRERRTIAFLLAITLIVILVNFTVIHPELLTTAQLGLIAWLGATLLILLGIRPPGMSRNGGMDEPDPPPTQRRRSTDGSRQLEDEEDHRFMGLVGLRGDLPLLQPDRLLDQAQLRC